MLTIRPIKDLMELDEVHRITHDSYVNEGYCKPQPDGRLIHFPHLDRIPQTTVLVAVQDGEIIGTNSLTLDGPRGLHVDLDFKDECDRIRSEDRRLGASWRIVTKAACRDNLAVVRGLMQETHNRIVRSGLLTCVFTFHPRHERIYKRMLNMVTVARRDSSTCLENAPSIFMRWDLERCPDRWLPEPDLVQRKEDLLAKECMVVPA